MAHAGPGLKPVPGFLVRYAPRLCQLWLHEFFNIFSGELTMVETMTSYKCVACGMIKTIPSDQKVPTCCGKVMQKTELQKPGESKEGSCCS